MNEDFVKIFTLYYNLSREKKDSIEKVDRVDQKERRERDDRRDKADRGDRSHPPAKRMRDEPREQRDNRYDNREKYDNRYDNRSRSAPRGREFVRGARSRGRGRGVRGASTGDRGFPSNRRGAPSGSQRGGSREIRGYENNTDRRDNRSRGNAPTYADTAKPFSIEKWGEEPQNEMEEIHKRRRDKDEESDVSVEEVTSGSEDSNKGDNDRQKVNATILLYPFYLEQKAQE